MLKIMDKFAQHLRKIMTYRTKELNDPQAEQIQRKPCHIIVKPLEMKGKRKAHKKSGEKKIYVTYKGAMIHTVLEKLDNHRRKKSPQGPLMLPFYSLTFPSPSFTLLTSNLFSISIILSYQECYMNGIIHIRKLIINGIVRFHLA